MEIAILGATGGCARFATIGAIQAGHQVTVLLRDPKKFDLGDEQIQRQLTVIQGDALNVEDIKKAIDGQDVLVSSIGGTGTFGLAGFKLDSPTICGDAMKTIQQAVQQVASPRKRIIVVSTTGIAEKTRCTLPSPSSLQVAPSLTP
ncbi:hypothetical protein BZG36_01513 [Bifiguratus adelaidae]|uniref:NAD(P)-binding domain-containing protein n=1 Tax=Bifiguratus adelaidae TaxID=1938954 RepID=A0A261Y515_9FUNG|nr:hypothetical protein BZG36_01513 [Bifiguratus adelaidae]